MSEYYQPPFTMTEEITNLVIEIGEQVGAVVTYDSLKPNPTLRRESRIRSIHSSLAIEQNTLTLEQVSDVIDGKRVLGPPQDIREVKNAYEVYERMSALDPYNVKNLLLAHRIMMDVCSGVDFSTLYMDETVKNASAGQVLYISL